MKKAIIKGSMYVPFEFWIDDPENHCTNRFMKERVKESFQQYLKNAERLIREASISGNVKIDFISNYSPPVITKKKIKK